MSTATTYDGDWTIPQQHGGWRYSFPFSGEANFAAFVASRTMMQRLDKFTPPTAMQAKALKFGTAYLVEIGDPDSIGGGILQWEEKWASLPAKRVIPGSIVHTFQFLNFGTLGLQEITKGVPCETEYEYKIGSPLPPLTAPRVQKNNGIAYVFGPAKGLSAGDRVLAEDSASRIYMGRIYERAATFVIVPERIESSSTGSAST